MKKAMLICVFAFLVVWCFNPEIMASHHKLHWGKAKMNSNSDSEVSLAKDIDSSGEEQYSINFEIESEDESGSGGVTKIQIKSPKGKKMDLKNGLGLAEFGLESGDLSFEDFQDMYPEGKYTVTLYPKSKYGSREFDLSYDFPSTPEITYPENGATDLPLSFTVEWESYDDNVDFLALELEDEDGTVGFEVVLSSDTTSFLIPGGVLKPDTQYDMELLAHRFSDGIEHDTIRSIVITTGAE